MQSETDSTWKRIPKWVYVVAAVLLVGGVGSLFSDDSKSTGSVTPSAADDRTCPTAPADVETAMRGLVSAYDGLSVKGRVIAVDYSFTAYGTGRWERLVLAQVAPSNKWGIWAQTRWANGSPLLQPVNDVAVETTPDAAPTWNGSAKAKAEIALESMQGRQLWACRL